MKYGKNSPYRRFYTAFWENIYISNVDYLDMEMTAMPKEYHTTLALQ